MRACTAPREITLPNRLTRVITGDLATIEEPVRTLEIGEVEVIEP